MSTQTTIVCDRCKDEITPGQQRETTLYTKRVIDLCPECQRLFTLFLQGSALTTSPEDWARDAAKQFEDFQPDPEAEVPERTAQVVEALREDPYEPLVNEVNEARRMRKRLDRLIEKQDNQRFEVTRGILTTAQLRHAISGDLEVADAASPE